MTAFITGTSTRTVDDLVRALGCDTGVDVGAAEKRIEIHGHDAATSRSAMLSRPSQPCVLPGSARRSALRTPHGGDTGERRERDGGLAA